MPSEMAPSTSLRQAVDRRAVYDVQKSSFEDQVKQRRMLLGSGKRSNGRRSNGNRIGRDEGEEGGSRLAQKRQLFNSIGGLQDAAAEASKALNGFLNPTRQASPESTTSLAPAPASSSPPQTSQSPAPAQPTSAPLPVPTTTQAAPTAAPPVVVQPTSQPQQQEIPAPTTVAPSNGPPQQTDQPSTISPVAAPTLISAPPAIAITEQPLPTNPPAFVPVDAGNDVPVLESSALAEPEVTLAPGLGSGLLPSAGSESTATGSTTRSASVPTSTIIQIDQEAKPDTGGGISPAAERFLISAGVICLIVFALVGALFCFKRRRGESFTAFTRRKISRNGPRTWDQAGRRGVVSYIDPPPKYTSEPEIYDYAATEKRTPSGSQAKSPFNAGPLPALSIPPPVLKPLSFQQQAIPKKSTDEQTVIPSFYGRGTDSWDRYGTSTQSAGGNMHGGHNNQSKNRTGPPKVSNTRPNPSTASNPSGLTRYDDLYSPSTQVSSELQSSYNNTGTQNTFLTTQTSNLDDPSQQENNRASTLSSLSSGFGDGLNIHDSDMIKYTNLEQQRKSRGKRTTRFSWQTSTSKPPGDDRVSTYTTASIETAPRFRSVNSWVAQQTGRVERERGMADQIPEMPPVPATHQKDVAPIKHQRQESDISAFNYHPGQEISITPGSRVASSVLDRKIGHISRSTLG